MEHHTGWSLTSDSCCSAVTYGCPWLSDKLYSADKVLPLSYVNRPSTLHNRFDIHNSVDVQSDTANARLSVGTDDRMDGRIVSRNGCRRGSDSGCSISSPLVDSIHLSTATDTVSTDADSTGVTLVTDVVAEHPGELTATVSSKPSNSCPDDIGAADFSDGMQPLGDSSVCSVCGDVAAGFHCGAYVCEACKVRTPSVSEVMTLCLLLLSVIVIIYRTHTHTTV